MGLVSEMVVVEGKTERDVASLRKDGIIEPEPKSEDRHDSGVSQ